MRIISGAFRGRRIVAPSNLPVRPTTDFAKEALFNVLNNRYYFDEITVLDLFSGIGSISLEFASRGSQKIVAVDMEANCAKFLSEMAEKLDIEDRLTVIKEDVFKFLERNTYGGFELIFADPFYDFELEDFLKIIELIRENEWLKEGGELILEHSQNVKFEGNPHLVESRRYGNVNFSFFNFEEK